ncbi:hypothetical protein P3W53_25495 [Pseudomonas denitrificans (nom. rej.)]|nr:hypothetical protein [Pseudomonas denitrificans (nom. rej.)]
MPVQVRHNVGAKVLPFLETYGVVPGAVQSTSSIASATGPFTLRTIPHLPAQSTRRRQIGLKDLSHTCNNGVMNTHTLSSAARGSFLNSRLMFDCGCGLSSTDPSGDIAEQQQGIWSPLQKRLQDPFALVGIVT